MPTSPVREVEKKQPSLSGPDLKGGKGEPVNKCPARKLISKEKLSGVGSSPYRRESGNRNEEWGETSGRKEGKKEHNFPWKQRYPYVWRHRVGPLTSEK